MAKFSLEVPAQQIDALIDQLPLPAKVRLVEKLERATWAARWDALVTKLRRRASRQRLTERTIRRVCEDVRRQLYARGQGRP